MLHEEFGVTHPHECDCGEKEVGLREALIRCIFATVMLNDRIDKLEEKIEATKEKNENPTIVTLEIYDGYTDVIFPEIVSEEKLANLLIEIGESFGEGEYIE